MSPRPASLRTVLITGVLTTLSCSSAYAVGLNLGWSRSSVNDCPSSGLSTVDRSSACATNAGYNVLIGSVIVPPGLEQVVGIEVLLDYQTDAPILPDWWRFDQAGCHLRAGILNSAFDPVLDDGVCHNGWDVFATSGAWFEPDSPFPGSGHVRLVTATLPENGLAWPAATEWYAFRLVILNAKTTGVGACAGCNNSALITFNYARISNPTGVGQDAVIVDADPGGRKSVTWQGGGIVPARRATWGQIKSLYR